MTELPAEHRCKTPRQAMASRPVRHAAPVPDATAPVRWTAESLRVRNPRRFQWPTLRSNAVPGPAHAVNLALQVRRTVLGEDRCLHPIPDLATVLGRGGFQLLVERLSAAEGRMEAFIAPNADNGFDVVVDPEPPGGWLGRHATLRVEVERHRLRFRAAHEMAHSFFYNRSPGEAPTRRLFDSPEQERFCDVFAAALLLPPAVVTNTPPEPAAMLAVQAEFDVSLHLTVRSFADIYTNHTFTLMYLDDDAPHLRPQCTAGVECWPHRWWAMPSVQRIPERQPRTVTIQVSGDHPMQRLRSAWIASRNQALLVGARRG